MPIRIPDALPATAALESENIFVMTEHRAMHQDIRPLRVLLLNLMPTKITTETQILRRLSNTPIQVEVELLQTVSHTAKNTAAEHLEAFYTTFDEVRDEHFDGSSLPAPLWSASISRRWTTGPSCARSWNGRKLTCIPRCTSAGAPRRASTTTTGCPSTPCRRRCSACFPTRS